MVAPGEAVATEEPAGLGAGQLSPEPGALGVQELAEEQAPMDGPFLDDLLATLGTGLQPRPVFHAHRSPPSSSSFAA